MGNIYIFFLIYRSSGKKDSASGSSTIHRRVKMNGGSIHRGPIQRKVGSSQGQLIAGSIHRRSIWHRVDLAQSRFG
jgi:hypothetical protein